MLFEGSVWLAGAGNMGGAMLRGWLDSGIAREQVTVIRPSATATQGVLSVSAPPAGAEPPAILILAMKPQKLDEAAPLLAPRVDERTIILSVLAGVETGSLARRFPRNRAVVRTMPNTPSAIGQGVTLLHADESVTGEVRDIAESFVAPLGLTQWIDDEALFGRASALSGCGPAFVLRFIDAMARAGEQLGLEADVAARLALATVGGAAALAVSSDETPSQLADRVASPGGSTRAGLDVIDQGDLNDLMVRVFAASAKRNDEMAAAAR